MGKREEREERRMYRFCERGLELVYIAFFCFDVQTSLYFLDGLSEACLVRLRIWKRKTGPGILEFQFWILGLSECLEYLGIGLAEV